MNRFTHALCVVDAVAAAGGRLELVAGEVELVGVAPAAEAMLGRLAAFAEVERPELVEQTLAKLPGADKLADVLRSGRDASPEWRALRAILRLRSRGAREVLGLPVAFARLDLGFSLLIDRKGRQSVYTTTRAVYEREVGRRPVWTLRELESAAQAVELGRATPVDFDNWLDAKANGGAWFLTPELAGIPHDPYGRPPRPPTICFGELFDALGAELVGLEVQQPIAGAA